MPDYKDKTTFIITCDHGRGDRIKDEWTSHGIEVEDSGATWIAVFGPDTSDTSILISWFSGSSVLFLPG